MSNLPRSRLLTFRASRSGRHQSTDERHGIDGAMAIGCCAVNAEKLDDGGVRQQFSSAGTGATGPDGT
jgi:hypothetical protein